MHLSILIYLCVLYQNYLVENLRFHGNVLYIFYYFQLNDFGRKQHITLE